MNTGYHIEIRPDPDRGYVVSYARKEPIDDPATSFPDLVPPDDPESRDAAFWFVTPGESLNGSEPIFQWFRHGLEPADVVAACEAAIDWTKQTFW